MRQQRVLDHMLLNDRPLKLNDALNQLQIKQFKLLGARHLRKELAAIFVEFVEANRINEVHLDILTFIGFGKQRLVYVHEACPDIGGHDAGRRLFLVDLTSRKVLRQHCLLIPRIHVFDEV